MISNAASASTKPGQISAPECCLVLPTAILPA